MTDKPTLSRVAKHSKELALLLSVPLGIILVIVALLYIPRFFANPAYDFIFCEGYYCNSRFSVDSRGTLQTAPDEGRLSYYNESTLYYYDTQRDASRPLQPDEAARYRLDTTSRSPDGYTLKYTSSGGGFLLGGNYRGSWSLSKGIVSKPVTMGTDRSDSKFIGWVLP